jgi:sugar porter (SP) family MFS transporter
MKINQYVVRGAAIGSLGGLLFGFDTAVVAGTTEMLTKVFHLSPRDLGFTVSIALLGTVLGAMTSGSFESRYGGRAMLRVMAILYLLSAIGCALAPTWTTLMLARFIGGIGIGGSSVIGPVYIAEISPANLRGRLVGLFQINIVIGVLLAYLSNYLIVRENLGGSEWHWEFGVAAFPALLFLVLLFAIPHSARWLATKDRMEEAETVLSITGSVDAELELRSIVASIREDASNSTESLFRWKYHKPILLAVSIAMFNQLTGINCITYYLNDIFTAAGFSRLSGNLQAVSYGSVNLICTLAAMSVIDKLGRRTLLLVGSIGTALCLAGISFVFYNGNHSVWLLPLLLVYVGFFAISQGAVIWVYLSEIFPTRIRGKGQSLGCSANWVMNALTAALFPVVVKISAVYPFVFFAVMMVIQFVVVRAFYPETKNVSLEQLQRQLGIDSPRE